MKINLKQPKYVLPVIVLPFLCLFFYAWHASFASAEPAANDQPGLNTQVGNVSSEIRKKKLSDKLESYRRAYKESDGLTAVHLIPNEQSIDPSFASSYTISQQRQADSIQQLLKKRFADGPYHGIPPTRVGRQDGDVLPAINALQRPQPPSRAPATVAPKEMDPIDIFRQQMTLMDSITRSNDPAYKQEQRKKLALENAHKLQQNVPRLIVKKSDDVAADFNTVVPAKNAAFISAVIDEGITAYAGSRLRLKLLENIRVGELPIVKGTYLYAQVTGFTGQRVTLEISTIFYQGKILPVKLSVFDLDGIQGLYVPSSAFREFTRDLGTNSVQGVTLDGGSGNSQFIMSSLDKVFQSTSAAISGLIRKNKAKLKYNSYLFIIDSEALQNAQKKY